MKTKILNAWPKTVLWKQSIFGLPWVLSSALLPFCLQENFVHQKSVWIFLVLAFIAARFAGMAFNRLIDHSIDAENPRTSTRPLPKGELSRNQVFIGALLFLLIFFFATYKINALCFMVSPLVAALLILYSFTKRFTKLCHYVLALIHCASPMCAWIAVTANVSLIPLCLGLAVGMLIAANDIIYACQDIEFDRFKKLYSIPAHFGLEKAFQIAKVSHAISFVLLLLLGVICSLSFIYFAGAFAIGIVYVCTYLQMHKKSLEQIFSYSNTLSSVIFLFSLIGEYIWRG